MKKNILKLNNYTYNWKKKGKEFVPSDRLFKIGKMEINYAFDFGENNIETGAFIAEEILGYGNAIIKMYSGNVEKNGILGYGYFQGNFFICYYDTKKCEIKKENNSIYSTLIYTPRFNENFKNKLKYTDKNCYKYTNSIGKTIKGCKDKNGIQTYYKDRNMEIRISDYKSLVNFGNSIISQ